MGNNNYRVIQVACHGQGSVAAVTVTEESG